MAERKKLSGRPRRQCPIRAIAASLPEELPRLCSGLLYWLLTGLLLLVLFFVWTRSVRAAESLLPSPGTPAEVCLTQDSAAVLVRQELQVRTEDGVCSVSLLVPADAKDLQISLQDAVAGDMTARTAAAPELQGQDPIRQDLTERRKNLAAGRTLLETRLKQAERGAAVEDLPDLCALLAETEEKLAQVEKSLAALPEAAASWKLVTLRLAQTPEAGQIQATYGYVLPGRGWKPVYTASCEPAAKDAPIRVRLEAEISLPESLDWSRAQVSLIQGSTGSPVLPALRPWLVGQQAQPRARVMALSAAADTADSALSAELDNSGSAVVWTPAIAGLCGGSTRLLLAEAAWTDRPVWTARPLNADARVFLAAEHALSGTEALWPKGSVSLSVDGIHAGSGVFEPREGKVCLSFGCDPRVRLETRTEPRKSGEQGIIGKRRVWEWAWTYTIANLRQDPVTVRVERPLPVSVDKDCEVSWTAEPGAAEDAAEKKLVWEVELPAGGTRTISHGVRASASADSAINPVAP